MVDDERDFCIEFHTSWMINVNQFDTKSSSNSSVQSNPIQFQSRPHFFCFSKLAMVGNDDCRTEEKRNPKGGKRGNWDNGLSTLNFNYTLN